MMQGFKDELSMGLDTADLKVKEILDEMLSGWSMDEMVALLVECEAAIEYNAGRIDQLQAKGLKKLYYVISGINRRNKVAVYRTTKEIHDISFKIQKILLKRVDLVNAAIVGLNDKVDSQIFWTQDVIKRLLEKLKKRLTDIEANLQLLNWQAKLPNLRTRDGKKYIEASEGIKILLVVSDIFDIVLDSGSLVDRPFLETILTGQLGLPARISVAEFYENIIDEKESLSLYVKDCYIGWAGKISGYGKKIYDIKHFLADAYSPVLADDYGKSVNDMCKYYVNGNQSKEMIGTVDICQALLNDLVCLEGDQNQIGDNLGNRQEPMGGGQKQTGNDQRMTIEGSQGTGNDHNNHHKNTAAYSILKVTPEGFWLFKEGNVSRGGIRQKYDYTFSDESVVETNLVNTNPYLVTAPAEYLDKCKPTIKDFLSSKTKFVSLADYYMYLWFHNVSMDARKGKKIVFIEYYDRWMYVSGYDVDSLGKGYQKRFPEPALRIYFNKIQENIKRPIIGEMKKFFGEALKWEDLLCFRTFTAHKYIDEKLAKIGVKLVEGVWEDILKTDNDTLEKIIQDIQAKSM